MMSATLELGVVNASGLAQSASCTGLGRNIPLRSRQQSVPVRRGADGHPGKRVNLWPDEGVGSPHQSQVAPHAGEDFLQLSAQLVNLIDHRGAEILLIGINDQHVMDDGHYLLLILPNAFSLREY